MNKLFSQFFGAAFLLLLICSSTFAQNGIIPSNGSINATNSRSIYNNWKSNYVDTWTNAGEDFGRVKWESGPFWDPCIARSEGPNVTASEGVGYGMLLAAYNNDKDLFDRLLNFMELVMDINNPSHGLMPWLVWGIDDPANGKSFGTPICQTDASRSGVNPATDGDMDMALALIKASSNGWTRSGGNSYDQVAQRILGILMDDFVEFCNINTGSSTSEWIFSPYPVGGCNTPRRTHNISYYAPGFFRVFADFTGDNNWDNLAEATYNHINRVKTVKGGDLVANFSKADGNNSEDHGTDNHNYGYDAARVPWRIATDYVWNGTGRAQQTFLDDVNYTFLGPISAAQVGDGYLVGATNSAYSNNNSPAFYGGFACGLMAQTNNAYNRGKLNQFASRVKNTAASSGYFNYTLTALYALLLSGEFDKPSTSGGNSNGGGNTGLEGKYRVKNVWTGMCLTGGGTSANNPAEVAVQREGWSSMKWDIKKVSGSSNEYRLQSNWGGYYLNNMGSTSGSAVQTRNFNGNANAQKWILEPVSGTPNRYRIKSKRGGKYLNAGNVEWNDAQTINLNNTWGSMQWDLESLGATTLSPEEKEEEMEPVHKTKLSIFPNPSTGLVQIRDTEAEKVTVVGITGNIIGNFPIKRGQIDLTRFP